MIGGSFDLSLIDILERMPVQPYEGPVWRVTRDGRDPTEFVVGGNRWDDGAFKVIYGSLSRSAALAEVAFHLTQGHPVAPSKMRFRLHELEVSISDAPDLSDEKMLSKLGVDMEELGSFPSITRQTAFESCQLIGEEAHFLGSEEPGELSAIRIPSARHTGTNIVIFGDYVGPSAIRHIKDHGLIEWNKPFAVGAHDL